MPFFEVTCDAKIVHFQQLLKKRVLLLVVEVVKVNKPLSMLTVAHGAYFHLQVLKKVDLFAFLFSHLV